MITIYGSEKCKDCRQCKDSLDRSGIPYTFIEITEDMPSLRAFLDMRDYDPALAKAREKGTVGIPFIVKDDGTKTLRWKDTVRELGGVIEEVSGQACSLDGKGC